MKKFIALEGIDACGKTFLSEKIQKLSPETIIQVNRKTTLSLPSKDLSTFEFSKNWFSDRTFEISPFIKSYVSIIQLRYLYENIIYPALKANKLVVCDSWWSKSICNIQYQNLYNQTFIDTDLFTFYEMIGKDVIENNKTFYLRFDNPKDAYKVYKKKDSPETILGQSEFEESFYLEYVKGVQLIMDKLAEKYNFTTINMSFLENNIDEQFNKIATNILEDVSKDI